MSTRPSHSRPPTWRTAIVRVFSNRVGGLMLALLVSCPASAQFNCAGSWYAWSLADPLRKCSELQLVPGPLVGGVASANCNACSEGYLAAQCSVLGGVVPVGASCQGQAGYCVGAGPPITDVLALDGHATAISNQLLGASCPWMRVADTGWHTPGVSFGCGTLGPDQYNGPYLWSTSRGLTDTRPESAGCPARTVQHRLGAARSFTSVCPLGSQEACFACGSYCVSSTDHTCPTENPVKPGSGAKVLREADYLAADSAPLAFSRTYNSFGYFWPRAAQHESLVPLGRGGAFGFHWRSNFDRRLFPVRVQNPTATALAAVQNDDGNVMYFKLDGTEAVPSPERPAARLAKLSTPCSPDPATACWELERSPTDIDRFNGNGLLIQALTRGRPQDTVTLSYDSEHRLIEVRDQYGRSIRIEFNDGFNRHRASRVVFPDGSSASYTYDSRARLSSVRYAAVSGPTTTRTYLYESRIHRVSATPINESG